MTQDYTHRFTEGHEPGGTIFPALWGAGDHYTEWLSMANHQRIVFLIAVGVMAQNVEINFEVYQAQDAAGTGAKVFYPDKEIAGLDEAAGDGDDLLAVEVRSEELDVDNGFCYVRGYLEIVAGAAFVCIIPLRGCSNYVPVPVTGWTEVV